MSIVAESIGDLQIAGVGPDRFPGFHVPEFAHPYPGEVVVFHQKAIDASKYLSSEFGVYLNPVTMRQEYIEDVARLRTGMEEFRELSGAQQRLRNLKKGNMSDAVRQTDMRLYGDRMDAIVKQIASLSLVTDGSLQSQFNGRVTLDSMSQSDRDFAAVLFLLSYRKPKYSMARAITETAGRILMPQQLSWHGWDELGEKFEGFFGRLSSPYQDKAMRLLPNELRLLAYGHRMGVNGKSNEYFEEIAAQAESLDRFDRLVDILRQSGKKQVSYETASDIFRRILNLPFLSDENGAFRQKDAFLRSYEEPIHRQFLFLLRSVRDIGIENMDHLHRYLGSWLLIGRAQMGALPAALNENVADIVGKRGRTDKTGYEALLQSVARTASSIG